MYWRSRKRLHQTQGSRAAEKVSGNDRPPRRVQTPEGRGEWAKGPIDLTRNEITSSFSSSNGGIFENREERTHAWRKSGRPAMRRARNGTNFFIWARFIWHLIFSLYLTWLRRRLVAPALRAFPLFGLHYLKKRKSRYSSVDFNERQKRMHRCEICRAMLHSNVVCASRNAVKWCRFAQTASAVLVLIWSTLDC